MNTVFKLATRRGSCWRSRARRSSCGAGAGCGAGRGSRRSRGRSRCSRSSPSSRSIRWPATYARKGGFAHAPPSTGCAGCSASAPGDPPAIDWLNDHAPHGRRARGGRRRLLGLRPRADLDLHGPADGDGLGRPRAPVGAPSRHAPSRRREALSRDDRPPRRGRCSTATASATSSSARSSERPTATPAGEVGRARPPRFDRDGTTVWRGAALARGCLVQPLRHAAGGARGLVDPARRAGPETPSSPRRSAIGLGLR